MTLHLYYFGFARSRQMVEKSLQSADVKRGHGNADDVEGFGRPSSAVVPENIQKVHKIVSKDREVKLRGIAHTFMI